jgi:hypothetical protein
MATCNHEHAIRRLDLPAEFEDLEGLLEADLRAMVSAVTESACCSPGASRACSAPGSGTG